LSSIIRSSKAETAGGTESGAAPTDEMLLNLGAGAGGDVERGGSVVEAGLAGVASGKEMAPPDCATAISSKREVAASNLNPELAACNATILVDHAV
jgi:hypothetical protein